MPTETKCDKKTESINALKNANKHLADLFANLAKKESIMGVTVSDLQHVAGQVGDIQVSVWVTNSYQTIKLKTYLEIIAKTLSEAR